MFPFIGWHDARDQVEREDFLSPRGIPIDIKGDAHLQQQALRGVFVAQQMAVGEGFHGFDQEAGMGPGLAGAVEHLVIEALRVV